MAAAASEPRAADRRVPGRGRGRRRRRAPRRSAHPPAFSRPLVIPRVLTGSNITLTAAADATSRSCPAAKTRMWTYNGTFPGPTIRRPAGQTTTVTLVNNLPATAGELTLHNHGNHSTSENDGQPDAFLAAPGGGSVTYTYTGTEAGGNERGAFQWYHDHRMDVTGRNVWMGLAGMYIIDDPADPQTLPKGEFDVPLLIADRSFDANEPARLPVQRRRRHRATGSWSTACPSRTSRSATASTGCGS